MSLFGIGEHHDGLVMWRLGDPTEMRDLLAREHYLGPLNADTAKLTVLGEKDERVVAGQVWKLPTSRHLPSDGTWLELARWCLTAEAGPDAGSRQHAYAVKMIRKYLPKVTTLVSYSDPSHGHTGALYRACNWTWQPTWLRLRTPPTGNGAWSPDQNESVKDRWVFAVRRDDSRIDLTLIDDQAAIRFWREHSTEQERRWARNHPQLKPDKEQLMEQDQTESGWQVWSKDSATGSWVVVDEGTKDESLTSAARRNDSARRFMDADTDLYIALAAGQQP